MTYYFLGAYMLLLL